MPRFGQRMAQRRHDQAARHAGFAEPHLGLGGMHVHVHPFGVADQVQHRRRMPVTAQHIHIGRAQGPDQQLVADRAAVDEQELLYRRAARIGRQGGKAGQADALTLRINRQGIFGELHADQGAKPVRQRIEKIALLRVRPQDHAALAAPRHVAQREPDKRLRHRQPLHHVADRLRLGPVRPQELQTCGCRVEKIAQFDDGAL